MISIDNADAQNYLQSETSIPLVIDAVDLTALRELEEVQEDGAADLIVELIDLYLQDAPLKLIKIQTAVAERDETLLRSAAHALKGSSGSIGARRIAQLCSAIEAANSPETLERLRLELETALSQTQEILLAERQRRS